MRSFTDHGPIFPICALKRGRAIGQDARWQAPNVNPSPDHLRGVAQGKFRAVGRPETSPNQFSAEGFANSQGSHPSRSCSFLSLPSVNTGDTSYNALSEQLSLFLYTFPWRPFPGRRFTRSSPPPSLSSTLISFVSTVRRVVLCYLGTDSEPYGSPCPSNG